jgi:hypothetical protein
MLRLVCMISVQRPSWDAGLVFSQEPWYADNFPLMLCSGLAVWLL